MKRGLLLIGVCALLAACESSDTKPVIMGNTVTGTETGMDGFTFSVPQGFEIYDWNTHGRNFYAQYVESWAEKFFTGGNSPYTVVMIKDEVAIAFVPHNHRMGVRYQRVTDMQSAAVGADFSKLGEVDKLRVLERMHENVSTFGDGLNDVRVFTEVVNGVPLGFRDSLMTIEDNPLYPRTMATRLGNHRDSYWVFCLGSPISGDDGLRAARELLSTMELKYTGPETTGADEK
ncbi:MAG: hypothetical protein AAFX93_03955 [Verrucomicrobiota bacterium]